MLNCSFLKNVAKPIQIMIWKIRPSQKPTVPRPTLPNARLGNTLPGPVLSGAVNRARIVKREPRIWAAMSVKDM